MKMKKKNDCPLSKKMTEEFVDYYPVGHSNRHTPVSAQNYRMFIEHGAGARLYDVDGNEYIDYCIGYGPAALGSAYEELADSLIDLIKNQPTISLFFTEDDLKLGKLIRENVPCAEKIKFSMTGTEAVQVAIRIARAYTGKSMILKFAECFHGWADNIFGGAYYPDVPGMPTMHVPKTDGCYTLGRGQLATQETLVIPFNDFDILEDTFKKYGHLLAICHFEAVPINDYSIQPRPGYLEKIRELCDKYNVVMSMDEVLTGFRVGPGGAQKLFGVTPDIATFGKMFAGGIASAFVCGKEKVMNILKDGPVLAAGTFNGWALSQRAAAKTLEILTHNDGEIYKTMYAQQEKLMNGLIELANKHDIKLRIPENPGCFYTIFGVEGGRKPIYSEADIADLDENMCGRFRKLMEDHGVLILPENRWLMSFVLTDDDIEWTLEAADQVMQIMKES